MPPPSLQRVTKGGRLSLNVRQTKWEHFFWNWLHAVSHIVCDFWKYIKASPICYFFVNIYSLMGNHNSKDELLYSEMLIFCHLWTKIFVVLVWVGGEVSNLYEVTCHHIYIMSISLFIKHAICVIIDKRNNGTFYIFVFYQLFWTKYYLLMQTFFTNFSEIDFSIISFVKPFSVMCHFILKLTQK